MKSMIVVFAGLLLSILPSRMVCAYGHANRFGGSTAHSYGATGHTNAYGGGTYHEAGEGTVHDSAFGSSTAHAYGGGTSHTNVYGGTTTGAYGQGAYHTGAYGYGAAYHPPTAYYGYHPPAAVNYYGASVNGWATAAAVTTAAVAGAAVASTSANANAAAASNAYDAGYSAGTATQQGAATTQTVVNSVPAYAVGQIVGALPSGCVLATVQGATYYMYNNTWFSPAYGANGVYYRVVTAP